TTHAARIERLTKIGVREPIECAEARRTSRRATVEPASCLQPSPAVGGGASGPCGVEEAPDGEPDRRDPEAGHDHAHAALPPALDSGQSGVGAHSEQNCGTEPRLTAVE